MHNILIYNDQEEVQNKQRISVNGILIESKNNITNQNTTILETEYVTDKSVKPEKVGMLEWGQLLLDEIPVKISRRYVQHHYEEGHSYATI